MHASLVRAAFAAVMATAVDACSSVSGGGVAGNREAGSDGTTATPGDEPDHDTGSEVDASDVAFAGLSDAANKPTPDVEQTLTQAGAEGGTDAWLGEASPDVGSEIPLPIDAGLDVSVDGGGAPFDAAAELGCDEQVVAAWRSSPPSVGLASTSAAASYDSVIGGLMKAYAVPGGAVAVVRNGKLVFAKGYGWADQTELLFAHPDSVFRIASLSKQITSTAILTLVQQGVAHLTDTPLTMLGIAPISGQQQNGSLASITVSDLLHHTGGWNRDLTFDPMFDSQTISSAESMAGPADCNHVIEYMMSQPLTYSPGTTYYYSNFGYCVLGAYIEKITATPYATWVQNNILALVGTTRMQQGHTLQAQAADGEVTYYDYPGAGLAASVFPTGPQEVPWPYGGFYLEAMAAHGAWIASPVDLLRFQTRLDGRGGTALLTTASLAEMLANPDVPWGTTSGGVTPASASAWYGYGWMVNSAGNWWHTGSLPGAATEQVHAANGFGWSAFFNTRPSNADGFATDLDNDLWTAFDGTGDWLDVDLFGQYGAYTGWMDASDYRSYLTAQEAAGNYPSRVEGQDQAGTNLFRAVFAPFVGGAWETHNNLDCLTFQADTTRLSSQGYVYASLQSFVGASGERVYQATWVKMQ
jgi:CubicO group peptidase (beta-lactamase class C family)